jgi:hypothetical protein
MSVDVALYHETLETARVTAVLGIQPAWTRRKGDLNESLGMRTPSHVWAFSTEALVSEPSLEVHIDRLLAEFLPVADELRLLLREGWTGRITVVCGFAPGQHLALEVRPEQLSPLASFGLALDIFGFLEGSD